MERYNKNVGDKGEKVATLYLRLKGYKILERNYRRAHGEVDIIARRRKTIVFAEVKTRTTGVCGTPADSVIYAKQKRLISAAKCYALNADGMDMRFDIIEVFANIHGKRIKIKKINHIKDAFHI